MCCRVIELRNKQVVSVRDGSVIGFIHDIEIDTKNGNVCSVVILGKPRFFGIVGREEDIVIPWENIEVIGEETVLVSFEVPSVQKYKKVFFS